MPSRERHPPRPVNDRNTVPFDTVEEAWFWFINAQEARVDGARFTAGLSLVPRPCEPIDILKVLDTLRRNRRLLMEHLLVLRHYGRRRMPPDARRIKEARAYKIWTEALTSIGEALERKGIVRGNVISFSGLSASNFLTSDFSVSGVAAE
jgi:hypothetical protein